MPVTIITNRDLLAYLKNMSEQITLLTEEVKSMALDISGLQQALQAQQAELNRLTAEVAQSNTAINALREEIEELQEMIAGMEPGDTITQEQIDQLTAIVNTSNAIISESSATLDTGQQAVVPTLASIDPTSAIIGGADVVMTVTGDNFTPESVIVFNFGDEPTTYIDGEHVSTLVKPSTAGTPGDYPVYVRQPGAGDSNSATFTFHAAVAEPKKGKK